MINEIRQQFAAAPDCTRPSSSFAAPANALKFNVVRQMRHARQGEPLKMDSIRHLWRPAHDTVTATCGHPKPQRERLRRPRGARSSGNATERPEAGAEAEAEEATYTSNNSMFPFSFFHLFGDFS